VLFNYFKITMSHFSQIKTQLRNLTSLQAALTDLNIDWKAGPSEVRGYQGLTSNAELVIAQDNGYDLGFSWNGNEYELVADLQFWQQAWSVDRFLNKVTQRYAYHTVVNESAKQGFQVAEQQQNQDGSIRLVVQRWA
jgi:hypothetical protein